VKAPARCFGYNVAMSAPTQIWDRIIAPEVGDLLPEVARYFLSLTFTKGDNERYSQLASKEHFDLSPEEKSELETLVAANTFLMLLQAKARLSLNRHQPAALGTMDPTTEHIVRLRGGGVCEYCRLPENVSHLPFQLDHIIARQHRGPSTEENLALACPECNQQKGPNIASIDWRTNELVRLFHPRRDRWSDHFRWKGAILEGITSIGEATVQVLGINHAIRVELRSALMKAGIYPRDPLRESQTETHES